MLGFHLVLVSPPWCRGVLVYQTERVLSPLLVLVGQRGESCLCECSLQDYPGVPFGLCQSPAALQRSVTTVLHGFLGSSVTTYLGDTFSLLGHMEEHVVPIWRYSPASTLFCKAGDVPSSGSHWTPGVLGAHPCYIFYLQNFIASPPAFCVHGSFSAVMPH